MPKIFTISDETDSFQCLAFSSKEKAVEYVNKVIEANPYYFTDEDEPTNFKELEEDGFIYIDEFEFDPEYIA